VLVLYGIPGYADTYLLAWWLSEPEGPLMHERMLDVEVIRVVEDSNTIPILLLAVCRILSGLLLLEAVLCCCRHG
jgi:hypothetical protein